MSHPASEYPISIVVCFHNAGDAVEHALHWLERVGRGAELVLVDDASRDGTLPRLRAWSSRNPHATVVALDENHGPARARNVALGHVRRDYVWFVDDDDEPAADALEIFDRLIRAGRPHVVFARARFRSADGAERWVDGVDESGVIDRDQALLRVLRGDVQGFLWSKLFHRSVLGEAPFGAEFPQEDFVGVIGAVERSERIALSPASVYTYVERPGSLSAGTPQPGTSPSRPRRAPASTPASSPTSDSGSTRSPSPSSRSVGGPAARTSARASGSRALSCARWTSATAPRSTAARRSTAASSRCRGASTRCC